MHRQAHNPWVYRHVRDGVLVHDEVPPLQLLVQHIQLSLGLHGVAVNRVLDLQGGIVVEVAKAATHERSAAMLPEEPVQALCPLPLVLWNESIESLRQVKQDAACLKHSKRGGELVVEERRDFGVGIHSHETGRELVQVHDVDLPGVVLDTLEFIQLLEEDGDLLPVGSPQAVQLQRVLALGELLFGPCAGSGAVHAAHRRSLRIGLPHLRDGVALGVAGFLCASHFVEVKRRGRLIDVD
mmetsp:Transcript_29286/g.82624  ORF Transcript_29286/g.82624 Transcript_29286/m.82624 type:complete len:240 (-) Transcript_29286:153-872(-)